MGRKTKRLFRALGVVTAVLLAVWGAGGPEDGIEAARQFVTFLARGTTWEAAWWFTPAFLAGPARNAAILAAIGLLIWVFWPERKPKPRASTSKEGLEQYGVAPPANHIVGGRAQDEPGSAIGPMPTLEAIRRLEKATEVSELIPISEAGAWLYDHASDRIKDALRGGVPSPFASIAEHGAAFFSTQWAEGRCELYGRLEAGLAMEKLDPKRNRDFTAFEEAFGSDRRKAVDISVKRSDLAVVLAYYEKDEDQRGHTPGRIVVQRDTPLREALMFAATGQWGLDPMKDGGGYLREIGAALTSFRQHAHDGTITVWGRTDNQGVWRRIDQAYWVDHYVDVLDVLRSETKTKAYNQISQEPLFRELMVCRAEFEAEWGNA